MNLYNVESALIKKITVTPSNVMRRVYTLGKITEPDKFILNCFPFRDHANLIQS